MSEQFDTDRIAQEFKRREKYIDKYAMPCTIMTTRGEIKGEIYRRGGTRIIDELNLEKTFIAVTNASFSNKEAGAQHKAGFIVLRQDQIVWIVPSDEEKGKKKKS